MYIFIATIFIAELIIALSLINLMVKVDKKVRDFNECVKAFNPLTQTSLQYFRCLSTNFRDKIKGTIDFFKKQHKRLIVKTISTVAIYSMLVLFKTKKIRMSKILNLAIAIRDIAMELAI